MNDTPLTGPRRSARAYQRTHQAASPRIREVSVSEVHAAMITVVAEAGPDRVARTNQLYEAETGESCIQGAMLRRIGAMSLDMSHRGTWVVLLRYLGYSTEEVAPALLPEALSVAQRLNDAGATWQECLSAFESVLDRAGSL
jgi:hypothetical protein